jgi:hypothetical protein
MSGGFDLFQRAAVEIVADLGASDPVKAWVAREFDNRLADAVRKARGLRFSAPDAAFVLATPAEFESATADVVSRLRRPNVEAQEVEAEADWQGAKLRRRALAVWVEGESYCLLAALASGDSKYDSRKRDHVATWRTHVTSEAVRALPNVGGATSAQCGSEAAAIKSVDRLISVFFKVELRPVS